MASKDTTKSQKKPSAAYRPKFELCTPLPSIDEFRLSTMLDGAMKEEAAAVSQALLSTNTNFQNDLRHEIRQCLTIEQKIQHKNIRLAKQARRIHQNIDGTTRKLAARPKGQAKGSLGSEITKLLDVSARASLSMKFLATRLATLDKRNGGSGVPDTTKYPRLAGILRHSSISVSQRKSVEETNNGYIRHSGSTSGSASDSSSIEENIADWAGPDAVPSLPVFGGSVEENGSTSSKSLSTSFQSALESESEELDPQAFEHLIDSSISKYRVQQEAKKQNLELLTLKDTQSRRSRNPIRLLSLTPMKPHLPAEALKLPFVTSKLNATVVETPHFSLHKKLRIASFPTKNGGACACHPEDSPAKQALAATLFKQGNGTPSESDADDFWTSSGLHTETDDNDELELNSSNSSDPDSSSSSDVGSSKQANGLYALLRKELQMKKRRSRRNRPPRARESTSPTPKHHPSHRTLKPKQLILKIRPEGLNLRDTGSGSPPRVLLALSPAISEKFDLAYRASPRASFVNEQVVVGQILSADMDLVDLELEVCSASSENARAIGKLRKLLV